MKTTMLSRQIANPRRTTLAHLKDISELTLQPVDADAVEETASEVRELPRSTANPRRTVLNELPSDPFAP